MKYTNTKPTTAILLSVLLGISGNTFAENNDGFTKEEQDLISEMEGKSPDHSKIGVNVSYTKKEIKIPYVKCTKTLKRISFDIPKVEWGMTKIVFFKTKVPKVYKKRVDISFDYPKCKKSNKILRLKIPEFTSNSHEMGKFNRSINIYKVKIDKLIVIKKTQAREQIITDLKKERDVLLNSFSGDINNIKSELKKVNEQLQKDFLMAQLEMYMKFKEATLKEFSQKIKNV